MLELFIFIAGFVAKAVMGYAIGKGVGYALNNLERLPTVTHYLEGHIGKSHACSICNEHPRVDSINAG